MQKISIFAKAKSLQEKFFNFFCQRKKVKALDNYASCAPFYHRNYLSLIKNCLSQAFLDKKEGEFLDHLLGKYELSYLDWAHKTRWLKEEMRQKSAAQPAFVQPQICFNFDKRATTPVHVPIEILAARSVSRPIRRV